MTKNEYTTLISLRLENSTLKAINQFCDNHYYLKRSSVINQALKRLFAENEGINIYDFLYNGQNFKLCDTKN